MNHFEVLVSLVNWFKFKINGNHPSNQLLGYFLFSPYVCPSQSPCHEFSFNFRYYKDQSIIINVLLWLTTSFFVGIVTAGWIWGWGWDWDGGCGCGCGCSCGWGWDWGWIWVSRWAGCWCCGGEADCKGLVRNCCAWNCWSLIWDWPAVGLIAFTVGVAVGKISAGCFT